MTFYMRIAAVLVLLTAVASIYWKGHSDGTSAVNARWMETALAEAKAAEKDRDAKQAKIDSLAAELAKKSEKSRQTVQSNLSKVDSYAPASFPPLPGSFRVWHDAAAQGQALDDSSGIDAPTVSLKDTATVIADNYASCNYDKYRLSVLQEIVKTINGDGNAEDKKD